MQRRQRRPDQTPPQQPAAPQQRAPRQVDGLPDIDSTLGDIDALLRDEVPKPKPCPDCGTFTCPGARRG